MTLRQHRDAEAAVWLFGLVVLLMAVAWGFGTPTFYDWPWLVE